MRTLIIAYRYPLPDNGGDKIRTMNFVNYFKKKGSVDVLYYESAEQGVEAGYPFDKTFHIDVYKEQDIKNRAKYIYEKIRYSKPWALGDFSENGIREIIQIIEDGNYDCILCRNALTAFPLLFLSEKNKQKIILDIDDVISRELHSSSNKIDGELSALRKLKKIIDYELYRLYQIKCARLGKSLLCSEKDQKKMFKYVKATNLFVVPNVTPEFEVPDGYAVNGHCNMGTILFVGHLSYMPNVQGIIWFVKEIYSQIISSGDQIKLMIIGKNPEQQLRALCNDYKQIELVDTPPDVLAFYEKCGAVIVPLLAGGGTRIKILEAGQALRPIITTKIGAYGLNLQDYEHVLYFDDCHSFVERHNWLKKIANYEKISNNMSNYVKDNYSICTFDNAMDKVLVS